MKLFLRVLVLAGSSAIALLTATETAVSQKPVPHEPLSYFRQLVVGKIGESVQTQ